MKATDTLGTLRSMVHGATGIAPLQQALLVVAKDGERELHGDTRTLGDCGLCAGDALRVSSKGAPQRGGVEEPRVYSVPAAGPARAPAFGLDSATPLHPPDRATATRG
jgi:hypothetical protein